MVTISNFTSGKRASTYSQPTQVGLNIQGNVGSILNKSECQGNDRLCINNRMNTKNENNLFYDLGTPIVSDGLNKSELLPNYPNSGVSNLLLGSDTEQQLNGKLHPALYGETTYGLNTPALMTNNNNDIGHEYSPFGNSNQHGSRALPQGKHSTEQIMPGYNIPQLQLQKRNDGKYVSNSNVRVHGAGDWRKLNNGNHYAEFINK